MWTVIMSRAEKAIDSYLENANTTLQIDEIEIIEQEEITLKEVEFSLEDGELFVRGRRSGVKIYQIFPQELRKLVSWLSKLK